VTSITKYGDYARPGRSTFFDIFIEYVQSDRILCWIYRKDEIYEKSGSAGGGSDGGERTIYVSVSRDMELNIQSLRVLAFHNLNFILIARDISYILYIYTLHILFI